MHNETEQTKTRPVAKNESVSQVFWRFVIPSVTAMLINGLYQVIDGIFVGHYVGYSGLAGINMAWPIIATIMGFGIMIGMGAGSKISIFRGEKKPHQAALVLQTAISLLGVFSLLAMVFLSYWGSELLILQGATGDSLFHGNEYIRVFVFTAPMAIAVSALPMLVRNDNSPKISTALTILGAILNIGLDYLYLGVLNQGLAGAAVATALSQGAVCLLALVYFASPYAQIRLSRLALNLQLATDICRLGFSSLLMFAYFSVVIALHNHLLMVYGGAIEVGAYAVIGYIATLYYLFAEGVTTGMQPPVSYDFGEQRFRRVKKTVYLAAKVVILSGVLVVIVLNLFPEFFITWFTGPDEALLTSTVKGMRLHLAALFLDGFLFLCSVYFMAVNKGGRALFVSVGNIAILPPFLYILPQWMGINGVWIAVPLSNLVLSLIVAPLLWKDLKKLSRTPRTQFDTELDTI